MFFRQIVHSDLGCASYVVASTESNEAAVVDPRWEIEPYLELANDHGFRITTIVETHNHADHVSGHGRLTAATGARILVHEDAGVEYDHDDLADGQIVVLGDVRLHVLHTPGHRPEHIALAVEDTSRGADPWLVLTGDSLLIGDVARPDLAVDGHTGAELLFESLHAKLLALPEFTAVYPAHVAGSLCGRVSSEVSSSTIGYERRYNTALEVSDRDSFVTHMNERLPARPPNMERIVAENKGPLQSNVRDLPRLTPEAAAQELDNGAIALDVRPSPTYLAAHIAGSIHVPVSGSQFGTRAGFVIPPDSPLVIVAEGEDEARLAAQSLRVVAYDTAAGYLVFGDWKRQDRTTTTIDTVDVLDVSRNWLNHHPIVDVREPDEWREGAILGSVNVPYRAIGAGLDGIASSEPVAVVCASGNRSAIAASLLERAGYAQVTNVEGGTDRWKAAGLPLEAGVGGRDLDRFR